MSLLRTVVYEDENEISSYFLTNYSNLGLQCGASFNNINDLFSYLSANEHNVDVILFYNNGQDKERFNFIVEIVFNNYCKNIIIVTDSEDYNFGEQYHCLRGVHRSNFDLILGAELLNIKRTIDDRNADNLVLLRSKISQTLTRLMFSCKHDGFKYFTDAIEKAYASFPNQYPTMKIYEEIGQYYGKTAFAIEKSMRTALQHALRGIREFPVTSENNRVKMHFNDTTTNNIAISLIASYLRTC